tara:strand:+ start:991 stop:1563 length:573 start_codon:yes stop_codon:yes gene_type:complete
MIIKWMNKKIDERIMKKMSEPIDKLEDVVYETAHEMPIDYDKLAEAMSIDPADIANELDRSEIAECMEIDYYDLAEKVDVGDIAQNVDFSEHIDYSEMDIDYDDLAEKIDISDFAKHIDVEQAIDYDKLVHHSDTLEYIVTEIDKKDVAEHIDMSELAGHVYGLFVSIEDVSSIISDIKSIVLAVRKGEE